MSSEIYTPFKHFEIQSRFLRSVEGVKVPTDHPFRLGQIPALSVVGTRGSVITSPDVPFEGSRLIKVSSGHGRSFEVKFGQTRNIFYRDEFGNLYSSISTKGNNFEWPRVQNSGAYPGFRVKGLLDLRLVTRTLLASQELRANHIDTEHIVKVLEPQKIPYWRSRKLLSPEDFNKAMIDDFLRLPQWATSSLTKAGKEEIDRIAHTIQESRFVIVVRGLQVSERVSDLAECKSKEELIAMMKRVFTFVNLAEELKAKENPGYEAEAFDAKKEGEIERYLSGYLPRKIAGNMATLHNLDFVHTSPHSQNISAAGGIYDLDDVSGEFFGDEPVKTEDKAEDIDLVLENHGSNGIGGIGFTILLLQRRNLIGNTNFRRTFFETYLKIAKDKQPVYDSEAFQFRPIEIAS